MAQARVKLYLPPSCAGCAHWRLEIVPDTFPSMFNHWCETQAAENAVGWNPVHERTERIAPPVPEWCKEERPGLEI